jgi:hypothetical protein
MSFFDRLRKLLAGPPRVQTGADEGAALHEEFGTSNTGEADLRRAENLSGGAVAPGLATPAAAEAAEAQIASEEAPPSEE